MSKVKVKFIQGETLQDLEDKTNRFLVGKKSLSAKFIGIIGDHPAMQLIYTEDQYNRVVE